MDQLIYGFFNFIGSLLCHQIPERTLVIWGRPLPVCARDTGIYTGFAVCMVYLALKRRYRADRMPRLNIAVIMCVLMIPMMADAASAYAGMRETNNLIRLLTGMFFGTALPVFLIPSKNFKPQGVNGTEPIKGIWEMLSLYSAAAAVTMAAYIGLIPPLLISAWSIAAAVLFLCGICVAAAKSLGFKRG